METLNLEGGVDWILGRQWGGEGLRGPMHPPSSSGTEVVTPSSESEESMQWLASVKAKL